MSPIRAAGLLQINTVIEPSTITSGGPTHTHCDVTVAAGRPPISTVGPPGVTIGPPTCGIGGTPGVTMGQVCMSVIRAAGGITQSYTRSTSFHPPHCALQFPLRTGVEWWALL